MRGDSQSRTYKRGQPVLSWPPLRFTSIYPYSQDGLKLLEKFSKRNR